MKKLLEKVREYPLFFKLDLKMKLTAIFILITLLGVHANSFSQKNRITLSMNDVSVVEVINEIEARTDFRFIYKLKDVEVSNKVSLNVRKERIENVLDILFTDKQIEYKVLNEQVVLRKSREKVLTIKNVQVAGNDEKNQQKVGGIVTSKQGVPLPGVTVLVKGTTIGTVTDFDGYYELNITNQNSVLVFSYIGFFTTEIAVNGQAKIDVILEENTEELEEVVVQAYRNTTSVKNTSAISIISSDLVENKPNISVINTLQARVAGLSIGSGSGQPGASPSVVIRGVGSINGNVRPLFVVDGIPVDSFDFRGINPNDIENVSVLKDAASAAAYGNRGANGVILITTKKGKYESGLEIDFSTSYGRSYQQENRYGLMNSRDLLNLQRRLNVGVGSQLSPAEINVLANQNNTDWTDFIFRSGETQNNQLSISNGGKNSKVFISFSHSKQEGIIKNTGLERYTLRTNLSGKSNNNRFNYGIDFTGAFAESEIAFDIGTGFVFFNPVVGALWGQPFLNPFRPDGTVNDDSFDSFQPLSASPYVILNNFRYNNGITEKNIRTLINTNVGYEIARNLKLNGRIGLDYTQNESLNVIHPESSIRLFFPRNAEFQGRQRESFNRTLGINANVSLNYHISLGDHTIDASIFTESFAAYRKSFGFTQQGLDPRTFFPGDGTSFIDGNRAENGEFIYIPNVNSFRRKGNLLSYFSILDYDYDSRFGVLATIRRDGTFRFAKGNRWGTFYSVSARWNLDQESFLASSSVISKLKLRASYGSAGNQLTSGADFLTGTQVSRTRYSSGNGYDNTQAFFPVLGNNRARWEIIDQADIGIDYALFNNKIRGSIDIYNKITKDLFIQAPVSAINGQFSVLDNRGKLRNRGLEFNTEYDIVSNTNLTVTFTGNIAYNQNEILDLAGGEFDNGTTISRVGSQIDAYYLVPYVGVNPANGNALYRTREGNITETFNSDDRVIVNSAIPKIQGGFGLNADYKGIFFQSNFSFVADYKRYNSQQRFFQTNPFEAANFNVSANYNRAWTPENPITDVEGLFSQRNNPGSDKFLHDASYVRLRYVSVGYNFQNDLLDKTPFSSLRVYLQGENLLTWTKWEGLDVESDLNRRFDFSNYPSPRLFTFGVDVKF